MLFIQVLNMSLTASFCILAVLLIRLLLHRMPKKYSYLLWLVVAFRLCCPVSFTSPLSLFGLGTFGKEAAEGNTMAYLDENTGLRRNSQPDTKSDAAAFHQENGQNIYQGKPEGMAGQSLYPSLSSSRNVGNSINFVQVLEKVVTPLWLLGMGAMLLCGLGSYLLLRRRLRYSVLLEDNIYQSEQVLSPFILGFWHPHIYLPFGIEEDTRKLVLAHERFHLHRRDHWVKLAAYLLLTVHWFNPLCWVAFLLMSRDMEMSCDEHVLAEYRHSCKPYCNALLTFATGGHHWDPSPLSFGEVGAKGRIHNALKWKNPRIWVKVATVGLCLATIIICGFNPRTETSPLGNLDGEPNGNQGTVMPENSDDKEAGSFYQGEGYSIYVPDGSWVLFAPDSWYAAENEQVRFWVSSYAGLNKEQVERILFNQGYQVEESGLWKQEEDTLYRVQCVETETDVWTLRSVISPCEAQENWKEVLQEIFSTFKVTEGYDLSSAIPKAVMPEGERLQIFETTYADETSRVWDLQEPEYTGSYTFHELVISNVTDHTFDFTVIRRNYETDESETILPQGTAYLNEDGISATFEGEDYTLTFDFSNSANPLPVVYTIQLWGVESLEGISFSNSNVPGYDAG